MRPRVADMSSRRWRIVGESVVLGAFTGLFGVAYLWLIEWLHEHLWGEHAGESDWFGGSVWVVVIPAAAGIVIGLIYRLMRLPPRFKGFIEDLEEGEVDPKTAPGSILIAVVSLISGPSLGPEAPLGAAGGAAGTWLARRRGGDSEDVRQASFVGISGAFGGLLSTPIGGPLLAFELEHEQTHRYYLTHLVPGVIAGAVSFGLMWPVVGAPFEGLLAIPQEGFRSWMLAAAVALGALAALAALVVGRITVTMVASMRSLDGRPVLRGLVGGLAVGLIGLVHPLTLFSGQTTLQPILADVAGFGVSALIGLALLKAAALGASLGGGFFGGSIFPIFFIGAVLGIAVHNAVPAVPLGLAVASVMAALGSALAMLPLSMAVLAALLTSSGLEVFGAVAVASVTAYALRFVLAPPRRTEESVEPNPTPD